MCVLDHIHASWDGGLGTSSSTSCGGTGGHYDPYLACNAKSQSIGDYCLRLSRNATSGYSYGFVLTLPSIAMAACNGHSLLCSVCACVHACL